MKGMLFVGLAVATTVICWGLYGPVLNWGQEAMNQSRLRPLIVIGSTYFAITVLISSFLLWTNGDQGNWTATGIWWSVIGGAIAATGAMATIAAFNLGGRPIYIMPIVFGGAPIVTAVVTIYWYKLWDKVNPLFYAGLIMVGIGAAMVLFFSPQKPKNNEESEAIAQNRADATPNEEASKDFAGGGG